MTKQAAGYMLPPWFLATVALGGSNSWSQRLWKHGDKPHVSLLGTWHWKHKPTTEVAVVQHIEWENKAQRLNSILSNFPIQHSQKIGEKKKKKKKQGQNKPKVALTKLTLKRLGLMDQLVQNFKFLPPFPQLYWSSQASQIAPSYLLVREHLKTFFCA